ncbi:hypothetical protein AAG906_022863 [Vitis piasezkii]
MASSSSLSISQAIVAGALNHRGSTNSSDRLPCAASCPSRLGSARRRLSRRLAVQATAVETLEKTETTLIEKSVNTIRFLAVDSVEKANSGHPGLPMGCAPMGHVLYDEFMKFNPKNPYWFNRDRFVLSAGHGCMLQYALLHLAGYDSVREEDLKSFRQWGSTTPGHPENFETPGVEVTTGPLGQGIANAVGLALAERHLAARFNKPDNEILIALYDDNHISIDGDTEIAFTENVDLRFEALGWHVIWVKNGNTGYDEIVTTTIGYGSPNKSNSYSVHGSALGPKELDATRKNLRWPYEPFHVPEDYKEEAAVLKSLINGELPAGWEKALPTYTPESPAEATRNSSQQCLNALANVLLVCLGTPEERNVRFGVREHGMGAICNGIVLHCPGLIPYCATFFVFTDYLRPAMRISALCEAGVIYVMTHDSIGLGEDGPTHQPIEHLASFRAMPNILMLRPADGTETAAAYKIAVLNRKRPSVLALGRRDVSQLRGTSIEGVEKGGYIVTDNSSGNKPDVILIGTGSELEIAAKAADELRKEGKAVRVVSLVCWALFDEQSDAYKESVLPAAVSARVSVEAASTFGWEKFVGSKGKSIGIDRFGASAPALKLYKELGVTAEAVIAAAKSIC